MFTPFKPMVVFYEKRGCSGNKRQQELLQKHGITLEIRSLLDTPWSIETLQPFFEFFVAIANAHFEVGEDICSHYAADCLAHRGILLYIQT